MSEVNRQTGTFEATGQSEGVTGEKFLVLVYGTFVGTVVPEVQARDETWVPIQNESYTSPVAKALDIATGTPVRLNCTAYTSGTITYEITGVTPPELRR